MRYEAHQTLTLVPPSFTITARIFALREAALNAFARTLQDFVMHGGLLTDELQYPLNGMREMPPWEDGRVRIKEPFDAGSASQPWYRVNHRDERRLPEQTTVDPHAPNSDELSRDYLKIQGARAVVRAAIDQLDIYREFPAYNIGQPAATDTAVAPTTTTLMVWRGELYALEGYLEIMLAELFCSGVPLNTFTPAIDVGDIGAPFWNTSNVYAIALANNTVVFHPSLTTAQVYQEALAKFDTALVLAQDSVRILNLARIGKGRAWLALGQYDSAAAAVVTVQQGYAYRMRTWMELDDDEEENIATVADREGRNGLPFLSSGDPRTVTEWVFSDKALPRNRMPVKYWHTGHLKAFHYAEVGANTKTTVADVPFPVASWEEAVLITAEAALHTNYSTHSNHPAGLLWLQLLNQLRVTAPIPGTAQPNPSALAPLTDPGTAHGRIALLFAERAYWLFLTGHRQGDLRRLIRQYQWPQEQVYPTGPYILPEGIAGAPGQYGTDVTMPIPPIERANPNFHGCLNRDA